MLYKLLNINFNAYIQLEQNWVFQCKTKVFRMIFLKRVYIQKVFIFDCLLAQIPFEHIDESRNGPVQLPRPAHTLSRNFCPVPHNFEHELQSPQVVQSFEKFQ